MVFKRSGRPGYYIQPSVPGMPRFGQLSAGRNKQAAAAMEAALYELAASGYRDLVDRVRLGDLKLRTLYDAKVDGPAALQTLRDEANDPLLSECIAKMRALTTDERVLSGYDQMDMLIPDLTWTAKRKREPARLSWLTKHQNITTLYAEASKDRKPNSVRRSLHRAVSDLLAHELGKGRKLMILADVKVPGEKDERDVTLTKEDVESLLAHCDPEFRLLVLAAMTTGVDRGPQLAQRVRDFREADGEVDVPDRKNPFRPRRIVLAAEALAVYRLAVVGKAPDEPIFGFTAKQVRARFEAAREAAGLPHLRYKDLRGVWATAWAEAGGSIRDLQEYMGWADAKMAMRYIKKQPKRHGEQANAAAQKLLGRATLKVEKGGAA